MAKLSISELKDYSDLVALMIILNRQATIADDSNTTIAAVSSDASAVRLLADNAMVITFDGTPADGNNGLYLLSGLPEYVQVVPGTIMKAWSITGSGGSGGPFTPSMAFNDARNSQFTSLASWSL